MKFLLLFFFSNYQTWLERFLLKCCPCIPGFYNANNSNLSAPRTKSAWSKRWQHFNATYRNIVGCNMLRAFGHPVARCCDMLDVVGSNLKMVKFFYVTFVVVGRCCGRLARFVQQCCTRRACALVRFSIPNVSH